MVGEGGGGVGEREGGGREYIVGTCVLHEYPPRLCPDAMSQHDLDHSLGYQGIVGGLAIEMAYIARRSCPWSLQGYLTYKKTQPSRTVL